MELHELSQQKRKNIIIDINKIMSEKYNISNESITNFWNVLILGVQYQNQCGIQQNTDIDVMYR